MDEATGELVVETEKGEVRFTKPIGYYLEDPSKKVEVFYQVKGRNYGFDVANYDRSKTLVIDPLLASTFIGGSSGDVAYALALDSSGNVYVAGYTWSSDYPTTPGAYDVSFNGGDVFVSKLNSDLSGIWTRIPGLTSLAPALAWNPEPGVNAAYLGVVGVDMSSLWLSFSDRKVGCDPWWFVSACVHGV